MKHGHAWAIGLLALTLTACGGHHHDDGGSTTTPTTGPGLTSEYRIEAVLSDPTLDPDYIYQDPLNIETLQNVQFQLVNYPGSDAASRTVAPTVGTSSGATVAFTTNDTLGRAGILTPGGSFTASSTDTGGTKYIVSATYQGGTYTAYYQTLPRLNTTNLRGRVVSGGVGVYNAEVDIYGARDGTAGARQVIVAAARTGPDGTFRAIVPLTFSVDTGEVVANSFTVRQPTGYGQSFTYLDTSYTTAGNDRPPLTLAAGDATFASVVDLAGSDATADFRKK